MSEIDQDVIENTCSDLEMALQNIFDNLDCGDRDWLEELERSARVDLGRVEMLLDDLTEDL